MLFDLKGSKLIKQSRKATILLIGLLEYLPSANAKTGKLRRIQFFAARNFQGYRHVNRYRSSLTT